MLERCSVFGELSSKGSSDNLGDSRPEDTYRLPCLGAQVRGPEPEPDQPGKEDGLPGGGLEQLVR